MAKPRYSEYMVVESSRVIELENSLDEYADEGWEVVCPLPATHEAFCLLLGLTR